MFPRWGIHSGVFFGPAIESSNSALWYLAVFYFVCPYNVSVYWQPPGKVDGKLSLLNLFLNLSVDSYFPSLWILTLEYTLWRPLACFRGKPNEERLDSLETESCRFPNLRATNLLNDCNQKIKPSIRVPLWFDEQVSLIRKSVIKIEAKRKLESLQRLPGKVVSLNCKHTPSSKGNFPIPPYYQPDLPLKFSRP